MSNRQLTTFPDLKAYEQAVAFLVREDISFEHIVPPAGFSCVAVPAIVMDREERSRWEESCGGTITCSGWVEYRPFSKTIPDQSIENPKSDVFGTAGITVLQPCVADDTKIRFVASITGDIGEVMPYLNGVMPHASYSPQANTITFMDEYRMVVLHTKRTTVAKADDIMDAWLCMERMRQLVNSTWEHRDEIEPCYETRNRPSALEIFKQLPGTNCGLCGEITCMAFALRLWSREVDLNACTPLSDPQNRRIRDTLLEICAALGIGLPG